MRIISSLMATFLLALFVALSGSASLDQFAGRWTNVDPNTGGITTLEIAVTGTSVNVHAWGKCHPSDCDWGSVPSFAFAPDVSSDLSSQATALMAVYDAGFSDTTVFIKPSGNQLSVQSFTHFKDNSGRSNYESMYSFSRSDNTKKLLLSNMSMLNRVKLLPLDIPFKEVTK
jgi:hypothetical protein